MALECEKILPKHQKKQKNIGVFGELVKMTIFLLKKSEKLAE
jgi:hypothetical protein